MWVLLAVALAMAEMVGGCNGSINTGKRLAVNRILAVDALDMRQTRRSALKEQSVGRGI